MKLILTAPAGKMGRLIVREALRRQDDFTIVGAVGNPARDYIGKDISAAAGGPIVGASVTGDIEDIIEACDGVVDFSSPAVSMEILASCVRHRKPLLIGTTGFTPEQETAMKEAAEYIPISESHNTSRAVNLIYDLLQTITRTVGKESDIDIVEMHDDRKADAPSGTAKVMGRVITDELGLEWEESARYGRSGNGLRKPNEITCHSIRSGNVSSSHTVIFGMEGERIELTHHAYDYTTFARGALDGVLFLADQKPGLYDSRTILGLSRG